LAAKSARSSGQILGSTFICEVVGNSSPSLMPVFSRTLLAWAFILNERQVFGAGQESRKLPFGEMSRIADPRRTAINSIGGFRE
jgi:hypothetical protein